MKQKYRYFTIFSLLAMFSSCQLLRNQASLWAPTITLKDAKLAGIDFEGVNVDFQYNLKSNAPFNITFTRLKFLIFIENKEMFNADNKQNIALRANETTQFTITQRLKFAEFTQGLLEFFNRDKINVKVSGLVGVLLNEKLGSVEVPFSGSLDVPVPKMPKVSFGAFNFKKMSLSLTNPSANFDLVFKVKNSNSFNLKIPVLAYNFEAAGKNIIGGEARNTSLPAGQETDLTIPVVLRGREIIDLVPKLKDLSSTSYKFTSEISLDIAGRVLKVPYSYP